MTTVATVRPVPTPTPASSRTAATVHSIVKPARPTGIAVLAAARRQGLFGWAPAVAVGGRTAVWISRVRAFHESGFTITLLRFDQGLVALALHAGGSQPGGRGWAYGDAIGRREARTVVAAFNSAFQENYGAGGFEEGGPVRLAAAPGRGIGGDVSGRNGRHRALAGYGPGGRPPGAGGPAEPRPADRRRPHTAERRHLHQGVLGDPLHEQPVVARSGLGVTRGGDLVWAGGHDLSVRALAEALAGKGVVRAMGSISIRAGLRATLCPLRARCRSGADPGRARADRDAWPVPCAFFSRLLHGPYAFPLNSGSGLGASRAGEWSKGGKRSLRHPSAPSTPFRSSRAPTALASGECPAAMG